MVIWQAIMRTSDSSARLRSSSNEATPFFFIMSRIIADAPASTPGIMDMKLGMPMWPPIIGIFIAGLPSGDIRSLGSLSSSVRP